MIEMRMREQHVGIDLPLSVQRKAKRTQSSTRIKDQELVKIFNNRGAVICAAQVTERVPPGTVHSYESSADYDPVGKPGASADRFGCVNLLTPSRYITKNSSGMAPNSCLVQIESYSGGE